MSDCDPSRLDRPKEREVLQARFLDYLAEQRAYIISLRRGVETDGATLTALNAIGRIADHVNGVASTLGFERLGEIANELDQMLNAQNIAWHNCEGEICKFEQEIACILSLSVTEGAEDRSGDQGESDTTQ